MSIVAKVTRTELSLGDLSIHDPGTYFLVDPDPGGGPLSWRRKTVSSRFVHGETLVDAVKENPVMFLSVAVFGDTANAIDARAAVLCRAFEQFSYKVHLELDGQVREWVCQPANYASGDGGSIDLHALRGGWQLYRFQIPRNPTPTLGSN